MYIAEPFPSTKKSWKSYGKTGKSFGISTPVETVICWTYLPGHRVGKEV